MKGCLGITIVGDANLCSKKWNNESVGKNKMVTQLLQCLKQNGILVEEVGITFVADHVQIKRKRLLRTTF